MKKKQYFFKYIIVLFLAITVIPVDIFLPDSNICRRIKTGGFTLLTASEIEIAIKEAGGWPESV